MAVVRHLPQQWKWFIAAALILSLACVLTAQYSTPVPQDADGFAGNVLLVKEGDADDSAKLSPGDGLSAALPATELPLPARITLAYSTTLFMSADYLVSFIIAPSRAPPQFCLA